jgi:hypothetical protein
MEGVVVIDRSHGNRPSRDVLGDWALSLGVLALVSAFVPVLGEFLSLPAALAAVALAVVGIVREHRGGPLHTGRTVAGGLLGAAALLFALATIAATGGVG